MKLGPGRWGTGGGGELAFSHSAPDGASGRPRRYSKVVSSGAIMPARAPASMAMLQMDMRASIDSERIASPQNSITLPVPPAVPITPMMWRITSLDVTPTPSLPRTCASIPPAAAAAAAARRAVRSGGRSGRMRCHNSETLLPTSLIETPARTKARRKREMGGRGGARGGKRARVCWWVLSFRGGGLEGETDGKADTHLDLHVLGALLEERLRGEHVLNLAGADAEGQGAESAVRSSVAAARIGRRRGGRTRVREPPQKELEQTLSKWSMRSKTHDCCHMVTTGVKSMVLESIKSRSDSIKVDGGSHTAAHRENFQPVTANDSRARKGEAVLWADDVHNSLPLVIHAEVGEAEFTHILLESQNLQNLFQRVFLERSELETVHSIRSLCRTWVCDSTSLMNVSTDSNMLRSVVGTLWSTVARVFSGLRAFLPAALKPSNA